MAYDGNDKPTGGALAVAVSNGLVSLLRQYTGRGPTKARTTIGRDHVLVVIRDALTTGERNLVDAGFEDLVMQTRRRYQQIMQPAAIELIEGLTGRKVIGMMSDNHANPDLGAEVFVLESDHGEEGVGEGDSSETA